MSRQILVRYAGLLSLLILPIALPAAERNSVRDCAECPELVKVPAGEFWMGSTPEALQQPFIEADRVTIEQPRQKIRIDSDFLIGQTEVTVAQYAAFVEATGRPASPCLSFNFSEKRWEDVGASWTDPGFEQGPDYPAVCLSWYDAAAYADWLSETTGHHYRLPSEAEWEYATRAGTWTLWFWGDDKDRACEFANASDQTGVAAGQSSAQGGIFECEDGYVFTAPAHFGKSNPLGLHGTIGNAGEWTADCLVRTLEGTPPDGSARVTEDCPEHAMRGGSWFNPPLYSRSAFRYGTLPQQAFTLVGVRVVRELNSKPTASATTMPAEVPPSSRIKRVALQVADLEPAVTLFRDVVGFKLGMQWIMAPETDPYVYTLYNIDPAGEYSIALFDTQTDARGLVILQNPQLTATPETVPRRHATVVETDDIRAMGQRAREHGFATEPLQVGSGPDGIGFAEMIIHGPEGLLVLAFEYGYSE